jgi:hypothetical protein
MSMIFTMIARSSKTMLFLKDYGDIRDGPDDCNVRVVLKGLDAIRICDVHSDCGLCFFFLHTLYLVNVCMFANTDEGQSYI